MAPHLEKVTWDIACGRTVDPVGNVFYVDYQGTRYYFCSESCRGYFKDHQNNYYNPKGMSVSFASTAPNLTAGQPAPSRK